MSNQVSFSPAPSVDSDRRSDNDNGTGLRSVVIRSALITAAILAVLICLLSIRALGFYFSDVSVGFLVGVAALVWLGVTAATIAGEYPKGDEFLLARLGLATFCRTAPVMVVVLFALNYPTRLVSAAVAIGVLYLVGLLVSVLLEIHRFKTVEQR